MHTIDDPVRGAYPEPTSDADVGRSRTRTESDRATFEPSETLRWLVAALSGGAGAIHLAMVPSHAAESLRMGLAFAAAGWFQIAFALLAIVRPTRRWLQLGIVANVVFIATWALSRTVGLPSWTGDSGVEPASTVDTFCVALQVGLILVAVVMLVAPNALERWKQPAMVAASVIPIGILVATTAVLASPSAANHAHSAGDDHGQAAAAPGAGGHDHVATAAGGSHDQSHDAAGAAGAPATPGDDHHHAESDITLDQLPPTTRAEVDQVIAGWATKYPTAADATAAGWFKATPSLYGIGAHFIKGASGFSVAQPFDMLNPNILLYDGEGPDAKFAGVSYVVAGDIEGFTGPYDVWHAHSSVCMKDAKISLTEEGSTRWYSEAECAASGGKVLPIAADKMIHLWIGPGYTDAPILAHDNPKLYNGYYPKATA